MRVLRTMLFLAGAVSLAAGCVMELGLAPPAPEGSNPGSPTPTLTPTPGPPTWAMRLPLSLDPALVAEDATNLPVLVVLNETRIDYGVVEDPLGADIRFLDEDEIELPYEIEVWNPGGTSYIWVQLPNVVSSAASSFWMYYGHPRVADGQRPEDLWVDYAAVWHLNTDPSLGVSDSSGHIGDGTAMGGLDFTSIQPGVIGNALEFNGVDQLIEFPDDPDLDFNAMQSFTLSAWVDNSAPNNMFDTVFYKGGINSMTPGICLLLGNDDWGGAFTDPNSNVAFARAMGPETGWHLVTIVVDRGNSQFRGYLNGVRDGTAGIFAYGSLVTNINARLGGNDLGNNWFNGLIDEVRIRPGAMSDNGVITHAAAMRGSLVQYGTPEPVPTP